MLKRFQGEAGKRLLIEALSSQAIVCGNKELASELAKCSELIEVKKAICIMRLESKITL